MLFYSIHVTLAIQDWYGITLMQDLLCIVNVPGQGFVLSCMWRPRAQQWWLTKENFTYCFLFRRSDHSRLQGMQQQGLPPGEEQGSCRVVPIQASLMAACKVYGMLCWLQGRKTKRSGWFHLWLSYLWQNGPEPATPPPCHNHWLTYSLLLYMNSMVSGLNSLPLAWLGLGTFFVRICVIISYLL